MMYNSTFALNKCLTNLSKMLLHLQGFYFLFLQVNLGNIFLMLIMYIYMFSETL